MYRPVFLWQKGVGLAWFTSVLNHTVNCYCIVSKTSEILKPLFFFCAIT